MYKNFKLTASLFWQLLKTDIYIYSKAFWDDIINVMFWFVSSLLIFKYIWPKMGMTADFAPFVAIASIVSYSFWASETVATIFIADLEGNQTIKYFFTLPINGYVYLIQKILGYAYRAMIPSLLLLPIGKLLLWDTLDLSNFSVIKFALIFVIANLLCGALALIVSSMVENMLYMSKLMIRFLFPMWFLGGTQFPWFIAYKASPIFAKICLLNPLLYAMEGIHAAVLGQEGFLSFYLCLGVLTLFTIAFVIIAMKRFKKRLDFI